MVFEANLGFLRDLEAAQIWEEMYMAYMFVLFTLYVKDVFINCQSLVWM